MGGSRTGQMRASAPEALSAGCSRALRTFDAKLRNAVDALAGAGRDAQDYMLMSAALGWLEKGIVLTHENRLQWSAATSVQQAIAQRNAQWAAEQSLCAMPWRDSAPARACEV